MASTAICKPAYGITCTQPSTSAKPVRCTPRLRAQHRSNADPMVKQADPAINIFWAALACIIVGSGFLKANISVIVGQLYSRTDLRRDGAYTIFYVGINVGAALGVIFAGFLGETYGWSYGFGAAGIGMLLGLMVFVIGKPLLKG